MYLTKKEQIYKTNMYIIIVCFETGMDVNAMLGNYQFCGIKKVLPTFLTQLR